MLLVNFYKNMHIEREYLLNPRFVNVFVVFVSENLCKNIYHTQLFSYLFMLRRPSPCEKAMWETYPLWLHLVTDKTTSLFTKGDNYYINLLSVKS